MSLFNRLIKSAEATLASSGLAAQLTGRGNDEADQARVLRLLLERLGACDYGRVHRLESALSAAEFAKRAPVTRQQDLEPALLRHGHDGGFLLAPEPCVAVLSTLDSPDEPVRRLPLTATARQHFSRAWKTSLFAASLGDIPAARLNASAALLGAPPGFAKALTQAPESLDMLVAQCAAGLQPLAPLPFDATPDLLATEAPEVLLAGDPLWLASEFPEALIATDAGSMLAKRPTWAAALGVLVGYRRTTHLMADQARLLLGHPVRTHEIFATEAGVIATQAGEAEAGLRLLTNHGLYFEFVPVSEHATTSLDGLGAKALPLSALQPGALYALLVSNTAGLCRYDTGELIRCHSTHPLRIFPEGRAARLLSCAGETLTERAIYTAAAQCCNRHAWAIVHLHVAPCPTAQGKPPAHEWWIELKPGSKETPTGPALCELIDEQLSRHNEAYAKARSSGRLAAPLVRLVIPGVFSQWLRKNSRIDARFCMPRCSQNRFIANELSGIAKFCDQ